MAANTGAANTEPIGGAKQESTSASQQEASEASGRSAELVKGEPSGLGKFIKSPATVGTITGAVVLGAAVLWGALEASIGAGAAYLAYRVLRKRAGHA
jgi:hypothetical protein